MTSDVKQEINQKAYVHAHGYQASNSVNVHFLMTFLMFMYDILRGLFIFVIGEVSSAIPKLN